jgi:LemA protein
MNKKRMLLLAAIVLATVAGTGCGYNTLNAKQQNVRGKWANVESQLQRRADYEFDRDGEARGRAGTGSL